MGLQLAIKRPSLVALMRAMRMPWLSEYSVRSTFLSPNSRGQLRLTKQNNCRLCVWPIRWQWHYWAPQLRVLDFKVSARTSNRENESLTATYRYSNSVTNALRYSSLKTLTNVYGTPVYFFPVPPFWLTSVQILALFGPTFFTTCTQSL